MGSIWRSILERAAKWMAAAVFACAGSSAMACSVVEGYRVPTNLELVADADVIAVVEVVSGPSEFVGREPLAPGVKVRTVRFLKGTADAADLSLVGLIGWRGKAVAPIVTPLGEAHFSVGMGACVRRFYGAGDLLLVAYKRSDGRLHQVGAPFSRAAENVAGPDDLWVRAAAHYVALTAGDAATLERRARADRDALRARPGVEAAAIARDIDRYLARADPTTYGWFSANGPSDSVVGLRTPTTPESDRKIGVYCGRDGRFGIIAARSARDVALRIGANRFAASASAEPLSPRPVGDRSASAGEPVLFRFVDQTAAISATREAAGNVGIEHDGHLVAEAPPGDSLYRLAMRCAAWR